MQWGYVIIIENYVITRLRMKRALHKRACQLLSLWQERITLLIPDQRRGLRRFPWRALHIIFPAILLHQAVLWLSAGSLLLIWLWIASLMNVLWIIPTLLLIFPRRYILLAYYSRPKSVWALDRKFLDVDVVVVAKGFGKTILVMIYRWLLASYHRLCLKHLLLDFRAHYLKFILQ